MSARLRALAKDTLVYGLGDLLLRAASFLTLPIYTRVFAPADYGVLSFVLTAIALLAAFLILGGDSAYARFFFEAQTLEERRVVTSTWFGFLALWITGLCALCLPLSPLFSRLAFATPEHAGLFALALLGTPITLMSTMCGQALRNQFRPALFTAFNVGAAALTVALSLAAVVWLGLGLAGVVAAPAVAALMLLPARLWVIRDLLRPRFSAHALRGLLGYGVPLVPVSLAYWVFASSDRFVVGRLATLEELGLYSLAASIVGVLSFATGALGQAWTPHAISIYEHDREHAPAFYGRMLTYILAGFGLLCVAVSAFAHELLVILTTPAFYGAAPAVGPLALGVLAHVSTQVTGASISLRKQTRYLALYSWLAAVLNLALNLAFVPVGGMIAASWSTLAAYLFLTLAYLVTSQRLFPIAYETRRSLSAAGLAALFCAGAAALPRLDLAAGLALKTLYCLTFIAMLLVLGVIDRRELTPLRALLRRRMEQGARS